MPRRRVKTSPTTFEVIQVLSPYVQTAAIIAGIILWAYNTFAQISYVKEQTLGLQTQMEKNSRDQQDFSDRNRLHMESMMADLKDTIKSLELRMIGYQEGRRR